MPLTPAEKLPRVVAGQEIKAVDHNLMADAIEQRPTEAQTNQLVSDKIAAIIGAAPENLDTLEEIAKALAENSGATAAIEKAITAKADTTYVDTELGKKANKTDLDSKLNVSTFNTAMATSDKFQSMAFDPSTEMLTIKHKDGTTKETRILTKAVYA